MPFHFHKFIATKEERKTVDRLMSVVAVLHPMSALPQVFLIYTTHQVAGISLLTWIFFVLVGTIFLAYGVVHKIRPLILTQTLWFLMDTAIIVGVILYR